MLLFAGVVQDTQYKAAAIVRGIIDLFHYKLLDVVHIFYFRCFQLDFYSLVPILPMQEQFEANFVHLYLYTYVLSNSNKYFRFELIFRLELIFSIRYDTSIRFSRRIYFLLSQEKNQFG